MAFGGVLLRFASNPLKSVDFSVSALRAGRISVIQAVNNRIFDLTISPHVCTFGSTEEELSVLVPPALDRAGRPETEGLIGWKRHYAAPRLASAPETELAGRTL